MKIKLVICTVCLSILFFCEISTAQGVKKYVNIQKVPQTIVALDWRSPFNANDIKLTGNQLHIEMEIIPSDTDWIAENKIELSSKLFDIEGNRLTTKVALKEGINKIRVKLPGKYGQEWWSSKKYILFKNGKAKLVHKKNIKEKNPQPTNHIYMLQPDMGARNEMSPLTIKEKDITIACKILSTDPIELDDIIVYHNEHILSPSLDARLQKLSADEYYFVDYITLEEAHSPNLMEVGFKTSKRAYRTSTLEVFSDKPNLHLLSIGTNTNLSYTRKDAEDFAELYEGQKGNYKIFNHITTHTLLGEEATASAMKKALQNLQDSNIRSNDLVMVFLSSHGFLENDSLRIQGENYDYNDMYNTSISFKEDVATVLDDIPCKKLVLIDACHSAGAKSRLPSFDEHIKKFNQIEGFSIITSSGKDELSYEDKKWENGAFTEAIIEGLKTGKADIQYGNNDGTITIDELFKFIEKKVPKIVKDEKSERTFQNPTIIGQGLKYLPIYIY